MRYYHKRVISHKSRLFNHICVFFEIVTIVFIWIRNKNCNIMKKLTHVFEWRIYSHIQRQKSIIHMSLVKKCDYSASLYPIWHAYLVVWPFYILIYFKVRMCRYCLQWYAVIDLTVVSQRMCVFCSYLTKINQISPSAQIIPFIIKLTFVNFTRLLSSNYHTYWIVYEV